MAKPYSESQFPGFGKGLNLRDKPDVVDPAQAIDVLNVLFERNEAVRQRDGYTNFTSSTLTNRADSLAPFYTSSGTRQLLAGCGTRLEALNASGGVVASATALSGGPYGFARFGQPNAERAYAGNGTDTLRKWDGAAWTAPTATVDSVAGRAMPKARYMASLPWDNRMLATGYASTSGGPNGTTSSPSHAYFSEAGDPETWLSTNLVQLLPGDGESMQGVLAWREFVFVFKETRFFVFYGTDTDSSGNPLFRRRVVDAGVGLASPRALCAGPEGVYFMARNGVYRTTGGQPELVSDLIGPIWEGGAATFYLGGVLDHSQITNCVMTYHDKRLYLGFTTTGSTNTRTLVYDPRHDWWTLYDFPAAALASFRIGSQAELVMARAAGSNHVDRHNNAQTSDAGTAITSRWRSGWDDMGSPDRKTIRESTFWGSGQVFRALGVDFKQETGSLVALNMVDPSQSTWGGSTWGGTTWASPRGLTAVYSGESAEGAVFSTYFENTTLNQTWAVHRAVHHIRETRQQQMIR